MVIVAWLRSQRHMMATNPARYARSLNLFGKQVGLRLAALGGLLIAAVTGASIYALSGSAMGPSSPNLQLSTNDQSSQAGSTTNNISSTTNGSSSASSESSPSNSGGSTSTSTNTTSTTVNGQTSTQVTVNGQPISVPANGVKQQTIQNPDGSTTQVTVSDNGSGVSTNSFTSTSDVQVDGGN